MLHFIYISKPAGRDHSNNQDSPQEKFKAEQVGVVWVGL